jgi:predicted O-methyltransferase YrrM
MNPIRSLLRPIDSLRRYREYLGAGRDLYRLRTIQFASGLGDVAWLLHGIARTLKPRVCVEIGTARGKSACFVARALKENGGGMLYAIDPHARTNWNDEASVDTYEMARRNLASLGLDRYVEIIRKPSVEAADGWDREIDLLFIDGDHSYEGVKTDWELFSPHLSPFGVALFHDTTWELDLGQPEQYRRSDMGVPRFVDELRLAGYPIVTLPNDMGVSIFQPHVGGIPLMPHAKAGV